MKTLSTRLLRRFAAILRPATKRPPTDKAESLFV
jgi:hypothetical protein